MAKVLIVEDDQATQDFLEAVLLKDGHDIIQALDGKTALELVESEDPDLVLSDLMLPEPPSDVELLKGIRGLLPDKPIVVISGYPSSDRMQECEQLGVTDFLTKPFEIPFVRDIVRRLTSQT